MAHGDAPWIGKRRCDRAGEVHVARAKMLLTELKQLWGEIGKRREEPERMVRELEAECMRVPARSTRPPASGHCGIVARRRGGRDPALKADNSPRLKGGATAMRAPPGPPDDLEAERVQGMLEGTRLKGLQKEKLIVINLQRSLMKSPGNQWEELQIISSEHYLFFFYTCLLGQISDNGGMKKEPLASPSDHIVVSSHLFSSAVHGKKGCIGSEIL